METRNKPGVRRKIAELVSEHNPSFSPEYVESTMVRMADEAIRGMTNNCEDRRCQYATMGFRIEVVRLDYGDGEEILEVNYYVDGNTLFWDAK